MYNFDWKASDAHCIILCICKYMDAASNLYIWSPLKEGVYKPQKHILVGHINLKTEEAEKEKKK